MSHGSHDGDRGALRWILAVAFIGLLLVPVLGVCGLIRSLITRLRGEPVRGNVAGGILSLLIVLLWLSLVSFLD